MSILLVLELTGALATRLSKESVFCCCLIFAEATFSLFGVLEVCLAGALVTLLVVVTAPPDALEERELRSRDFRLSMVISTHIVLYPGGLRLGVPDGVDVGVVLRLAFAIFPTLFDFFITVTLGAPPLLAAAALQCPMVAEEPGRDPDNVLCTVGLLVVVPVAPLLVPDFVLFVWPV